MRKNCLFKLIPIAGAFISLFLFSAKPTLAVQCEYIPKDSVGTILYADGITQFEPWLQELSSEDCLDKCTELTRWCRDSNRPENCDVASLKCGEVAFPTLTVTCKFTPRNLRGGVIDSYGISAREVLSTSESACQRMCDDLLARCMAIDIAGSPLCSDSETTCEKISSSASPSSDTSTSPTPYNFSSTTPRLEIPLPTLPSFSEFTDLTLQGEAPNRYLWVPWIGQYIAAIYKYAIGIVGILAGIMIVVGGLLWLTAGGAADRVSTAKSFIESSLVGLVIALTSYLLLYAINPNLVGFESLKVKYIERSVMDPLMSHELFQEDTPGMPASGAPVVSSSGAVDVSTLVRVDMDCLHTNSPVDPRWEDPLKKVAETFCRLRGSNTGWKIVGGGYRPPTDAVTFYVRRCLFRSSCTIPTGNPLTDGTIVTEEGIKVPADSSIKALRGNESALVNALLPFVKTDRPGHGSGLAFDAYCQREGVEGRQTHLKPYVPCQLLLEQAFKENGFCRLNNENWHFELTSLKASRSCNENWTIGTVQKSASGPVLDFRTCPNYWAWDNETCLDR